jgi:hypothetical protein
MKRPIGLPVTRVVEPNKKRGFCSALAAFAAGYIHVPEVALEDDGFMPRGRAQRDGN